MNTLQLVLLLISANVIVSEDIVNKTEPVSPEPKNFKFEDQPDPPQSYGLVRFEENTYQQFDGQNSIDNDGQRIKFEENRQRPNQQKKKRRRRPKQRPNGTGQNGGPGYPVMPYPGSGIYPGPSMNPGPVPGPVYNGQRPYPVGYPVPQYKPRPSATSAALSAVTEALSSIAQYDDAQCVPRLLCEAAGGTGSIPGAGLLQSVAGLQPLLTLLAAYNGISSSPLFVFGRAVFLGMTSKANPGTCRYAYPQCPNDPEQLVHYLNNHNGGFFRFFAAPELNQQQGLEQFYNQLSGQNYGLYQPQTLQHNLLGQNYGLYQPQTLQHNQLPGQNGLYQPQALQHNQLSGQNYGLYQSQNNQNLQQGYGLQPQNLYNGQYQHQSLHQGSQQQQYFNQYNQNPYGNGYEYGQRYPYQQNLNQNYFKSKIQKRILNAQNTEFTNVNPKWTFPESNRNIVSNIRLGKVLKFPQGNVESNAAAEGFVFPGIQSNRQYLDIFEFDGTSNFAQNFNDFRIYSHENDGVDGFNEDTSYDDGTRILYVVRGNADPNHPEVVHLAPGQTL